MNANKTLAAVEYHTTTGKGVRFITTMDCEPTNLYDHIFKSMANYVIDMIHDFVNGKSRGY